MSRPAHERKPRSTRTRTPRLRRKRLATALALCGAALVARGLWIPAKAQLAQHLIAGAWDRRLAGEARPLPWPWADTWPIARLTRPRSGHAPLYVLRGTSGQSLAFGPAHVSASAAPGSPDNVVIAGHRDTHFAFLRELVAGDEIVVESDAGTARYAVQDSEIVHESRLDLLGRTGRPELTLITCFPFDAIVPGGPMRFIIHARQISPESRPKAPAPEPKAASRTSRRSSSLVAPNPFEGGRIRGDRGHSHHAANSPETS